MVRFSEIQQFPDFLELFPGNFRTICLRFENFEFFGRMVSALDFPDSRYSGLYGKTSEIHLSDFVMKTYVIK